MLYQGAIGGWVPATRNRVEPTALFARQGGTYATEMALLTERPDNARLEGLGCEGSRTCGPCATALANELNTAARLSGYAALGRVTEATYDEADALAFVQDAQRRLLAIGQRVSDLGSPVGWMTWRYAEELRPIQADLTAIAVEARDHLLPDTDETLAVVRGVDQANAAITRLYNSPNADLWRAALAYLTNNPLLLITSVRKVAHQAIVTGGELVDVTREAVVQTFDYGKIALYAALALGVSFLLGGRR